MILVMDVGNTNIKLGVYDGKDLRYSWRMRTDEHITSDEYGMSLLAFLSYSGLSADDINGAIISSVVPSINYTVEHMVTYFLKCRPLFVGPGVKTGINIKYDNPREVGSDRICNAVAAYEIYGGPVIFIDFGTATTFGVVDEGGSFLGGAICAGIKVSVEALSEKASRLPKIELDCPPVVINKNTVSNIQAGIIYGYVGQVDYIVERMRREIGSSKPINVVATGGQAQIIAPISESVKEINSRLTLEGLRRIYERNA